MSYNHESEVSEALGQLLKIEKDYNVIIHIGVEPNFKEFRAYSHMGQSDSSTKCHMIISVTKSINITNQI